MSKIHWFGDYFECPRCRHKANPSEDGAAPFCDGSYFVGKSHESTQMQTPTPPTQDYGKVDGEYRYAILGPRPPSRSYRLTSEGTWRQREYHQTWNLYIWAGKKRLLISELVKKFGTDQPPSVDIKGNAWHCIAEEESYEEAKAVAERDLNEG